jgi:hypothetical protein
MTGLIHAPKHENSCAFIGWGLCGILRKRLAMSYTLISDMAVSYDYAGKCVSELFKVQVFQDKLGCRLSARLYSI